MNRFLLVIADGVSGPDVGHVASEYYLGYGVDESEVAGVEIRDVVAEGWWHPNTNAGRVHDHPENPGGGWSQASHRLCEPVYTARVGAKRSRS